MGMLPIRKVAADKVALTSYYGKAFIMRSPKASANYSRWILNQMTKLSMNTEETRLSGLVFYSGSLPKSPVPRAYSAIGAGILSFKFDTLDFYFGYSNRLVEYDETKVLDTESRTGMVVCGRTGKQWLVMDTDGTVYRTDIKTDPVRIGTVPEIVDPNWGPGPNEYVTLNVYGKAIPVGILISYLTSLNALLKRLKVKHRWVPSGSALNLLENEVRIRFKDESLIYQEGNAAADLLLAGYNGFSRAISELGSSDFNTTSSYGHLLEMMSIGRHVLKEVTLMNRMFIDPITLELLKTMHEPETFIDLLYRSAELLINDAHTDEMDSSMMRIKGYERFSGFIYTRLVSAIREQRNTENPKRNKVDLPERAVWSDILSDPSIVLVEDSNPIHNLKEKEGVTFTGQGGRTAQTMVASTRLFHPNDLGVISEATPDSGKVAIKTYLTPNAKLNNLRGTTDRYDAKSDGLNSLLSTTALISPGSTMNDPKRVLIQ